MYNQYYLGSCEMVLPTLDIENKAQLIFTSPPFVLNTKKKYGNESVDTYMGWFLDRFHHIVKALNDNGSLVIEMGNAWQAPILHSLFYLCNVY